MKLIDLDYAIQQAQEPSIYDLCDTVDFLKEQPIVDGIHAAGGCYCKECQYSTQQDIPWKDLIFCKLHRDTMPLDGFCSEGRKDDMKNA